MDATTRRDHDLRNAFNALWMTCAVLRRALEDGDAERATALALEAERACQECGALLATPPSPSPVRTGAGPSDG